MVDLTFRTLGAWGAGKGANLEAVEVDNNFWSLAQAIVDIQNNPAVPNGIASISVSGTQMTITLHDGTVLGPYTLPVLTFRWRDEWQPFTSYAVLDVVKVTNTGIYMVQIAHTSGNAFDPNLLIGGLPAFLWLFGSADASLSSLPDVLLTALHDGDFLHWQATPAKWENIALGTMAYQNAVAVAITGGSVTGLPTPVNPSDAATKAFVEGLITGGVSAPDSTMMSNIAGSTAAVIPNTLSNFLDHVLGTTRGALMYRGGAGWLALLPGTSGNYLRTNGSGADPAWSPAPGGVTNITAGTGISTGGAPITGTGAVSLAAIADSNLLGNAAGASAAPVPLTLTQFLDHALTGVRGTVLTRNVTGWVALLPGTSGLFLKSQGAAADLMWDSPLGAGTVTSVAAGTGLTTGGAPITSAGTILFAQVGNGTLLANISGATAAPVPSTLSLILDNILSSTQGAIMYRGAAAWSALAPGTSGQFLQTGGASANPSWASASGAAPIGASQVPANLTTGTALALGHTLSDIFDYIVSSARGTLIYRAAGGWLGLAPGTAGQVLSTGGATGDPNWINPSTAPSSGLIARRNFTVSATYTPTAGTGWVMVTVVGAGGAGGGVGSTTTGQQAEGSGGGSGGAVQRTIATGFSGAAIVVGAAGVAVSGAAGGNGGASSFGTLTAGGGQGGLLGNPTVNAGVMGGPGGTATGGDLNIPGERGWVSSMTMNGGAATSGRGGSTPLGYGSGGEEMMASNAGVAGTGYGSGGSGAIIAAGQAARAGGNGAPGLVIVDEYRGAALVSFAVDGHTSNHAAGATTLALTLTTAQANDVIVVCSHAGHAGATTVAISSIAATGLTFTRRSTGTVADNFGPPPLANGTAEVWWAVASAPLTSATITITYAAATEGCSAVAFGVSGANTAAPWDTNGALPGITTYQTSVTPAAPISTTNAADMLLAIVTETSIQAISTAPTGYTLVDSAVDTLASHGSGVGVASNIVSTAQSAVTVTWPTSFGSRVVYILDALRSA